ncbi:MAG: CbtB-domain containing protein [Actinomycetota bacterium]|nr:CbtB-domain containing protein [Actinomycetota bacterium]
MSEAVAIPRGPSVQISPIPIREWLPYAVFAGVMMFFLIYLVGADEGATSLVQGHMVHEFVHDARHLLGFPCH